MTAKKINFLIILFILLFCFVGGFVCVYEYNLSLELDAKHDEETAKQREEYEKNTLDDINTSVSNENKNDGNTLAPPVNNNGGNSDNVDVSNFNFLQMYTHAENKLNKATNIYSKISGSALLSGPTSFGGIKLNNEKVSITAERAQNSNNTFVNFKVTGNLLNGLFYLNYETASFSDGASYYWFFNQEKIGWQRSSKINNYNKLRFETNQTFHEITADSFKTETSNIFYNKYDQTYTGTCELKPEISTTRYAYTLKGVLDGNDKANFLSSKIEVVFDKYGSFKSIRYIDNFKIDVYAKDYDTTMYATIQSDYIETFVTIGNRTVSIIKPSGIK